MFAWARKERLSQRSDNCDTAKSYTDTRLQSHPSSPAHSSGYSLNSQQRASPSSSKRKIVLYSKQKRRKLTNESANLQNSFSKTDLMELINQKQGHLENTQNICKSLFDNTIKAKRTIKLKIQVNRTLDEYCRAAKQILNSNIWGIFGAALILLKMGFIHDLVNDRHLVKKIWETLGYPDMLGFYIFLELSLSNKIQLNLATESICQQLNIKISDLDKEKANKITEQKLCKDEYETLRLNRLARQKKLFQL